MVKQKKRMKKDINFTMIIKCSRNIKLKKIKVKY